MVRPRGKGLRGFVCGPFSESVGQGGASGCSVSNAVRGSIKGCDKWVWAMRVVRASSGSPARKVALSCTVAENISLRQQISRVIEEEGEPTEIGTHAIYVNLTEFHIHTQCVRIIEVAVLSASNTHVVSRQEKQKTNIIELQRMSMFNWWSSHVYAILCRAPLLWCHGIAESRENL